MDYLLEIDHNKLVMTVHPEDLECRSREFVCVVDMYDQRHMEVLRMAQAAPELLKALDNLLEFSQDHGPERAEPANTKAVYSQWEPYFNAAILAVRKAKGIA